MIAALFVDESGVYAELPDVEVWGCSRDARNYNGPHSVICHAPCQRWGKYWFGGPLCRPQKVKGDDGGCFSSALKSVRQWGGVLEHPACSHAWHHFGLQPPPTAGGWVNADYEGGWTCCVDQGHYGHRARKPTWLYAVVPFEALPSLQWGKSAEKMKIDDGFHSAEERQKYLRNGSLARITHRERSATPLPFRDLLLAIATRIPHMVDAG